MKKKNYSKETDKQLYEQIKECTHWFLTSEMLEMCYHPYNLQKNEAMNQKVMKFAPKNKTHSKSLLLRARITLAVGTDCLGTDEFAKQVFSNASICLSLQTDGFLQKFANNAKKKIEREQTPAFKWKRAKNEKLQLAATLKKDAEARRQGKYYGASLGIAIQDAGEEMEQQGMTKGKRKTNSDQCKNSLQQNSNLPVL